MIHAHTVTPTFSQICIPHSNSHPTSRQSRQRRYSLLAVILLALFCITPGSEAQQSFPGNFSWKLGYDRTVPQARGAVPPVNVPFVDDVHGTTITRITEDPNGWRRHEYSRRPAFNADSTKIIMRSSGGYWHLYQISGDSVVYEQSLPVMTEPNWHATDPNRFFYLLGDGDDQRIHEYNITSQASRVAVNFTGRLPWSGVRHVWTRWEGRPSSNGRYWCLMAEDENYQALGMFSYDMQENRIIGTMDLAVDPDHISTSVTGRYCIPSASSPFGTRAYNLSFSRYTQLHTTSEHSDTAIDRNGADVLVLADFSDGYVSMVNMSNGKRTRLIPIYVPQGGKFSVHFSGLATSNPGYVIMSTYDTTLGNGSSNADYGDMWGHDRLAVVELKANPTIYNIAYMQNGRADYWSEPQATVNHDLTRIIFASTWGSNSDDDARSYMVHLSESQSNDQLRATISRKVRHTMAYLQATPRRHFRLSRQKDTMVRRLRALKTAYLQNDTVLVKKHAEIFKKRIDGCGRRAERDDYVIDCAAQSRLIRNFLPVALAADRLAQ